MVNTKQAQQSKLLKLGLRLAVVDPNLTPAEAATSYGVSLAFVNTWRERAKNSRGAIKSLFDVKRPGRPATGVVGSLVFGAQA